MYIQTQNVHTKRLFLAVCMYKKALFPQFCMYKTPFCMYKFCPLFGENLGRKWAKRPQNVHTNPKCTYKNYNLSSKFVCTFLQKWAEAQKYSPKMGKMYIQIFAILYYSVCTKYRLYNMVKPFRKTSLQVFPVFSHTSRTVLNSSALILTLISLLP